MQNQHNSTATQSKKQDKPLNNKQTQVSQSNQPNSQISSSKKNQAASSQQRKSG